MEAGLFVWSGTPPAAKPALSVPELSVLAARLSDRGELQPAFLCRKRIAELTPSDPGVWYELGNAAYYLGRREDAHYSYAKYLESHPEDARLHQIMAALKGDAPPSRAPDECIRQIYRSFSAKYDALMREELEYQSPEHVQKLVEKTHPGRNNLKVLDLGCGSGLSGIHLRPRADELTGVDLSPEMIAVASSRNTYDRLEVAEATEWLDSGGESFDLIVACEVLVYFGDLRGVTRSVSRRLNDGGVFVFTVERDDQPGYHLTDTGRYMHDTSHIADVAKTAGLTIEQLEQGTLRLENGAPVIGIVAALRKKA
jgi:predicted TPR repeat methyltransferase